MRAVAEMVAAIKPLSPEGRLTAIATLCQVWIQVPSLEAKDVSP